LCEDLDECELAAGALAEVPVDGASAAIAAEAIPTDNRADAISLIMGSPAKGFRAMQRIRPIRENHSR
jgi:hypothetical protein